jgi:CheY-like chemotaxis protein
MITIYIADDDEDDRMLLREALTAVIKNVRIVETCNGNELLQNLDQNEFLGNSALILMDMNMPKLNGLEALSRIRANERMQHVPVIMLSTASSPDLIKTAYHSGINAYMTKPFLPDDYVQIAQAVNVCFLNNQLLPQEQMVVRGSKMKNVLIVEDNADHSKLIKMALSSTLPHANVIGICDEAGTLDYLANQWQDEHRAPEMILLDLYLPDRKDGLDLLDRIRTFLFSKNLFTIPIIIVSHSDDSGDITDCYRQRANAYMVKAPDLGSWINHFSNLCHFWTNTIVLPKAA